jgi:CheY-like chemotaxis protein
VIISDIGMPDMDGYELARRMRREPGLQGVVLVALTGYGREGDRRQVEEAGFDYHLVKPASIEALQELLGSLPAPSQTPSPWSAASNRRAVKLVPPVSKTDYA